MKTRFTKLLKINIFVLALVCSAATQSLAQNPSELDFSDFLKADPADANKVLEGYMTPALNAFGVGIANGWYNTAAPHKFPGFDLTITGNLVQIPTSDLSFALQGTTSISASGGELPTIFGEKDPTSQISINATREENGTEYTTSVSANAPGGIIPVSFMPIPTAQLGIGLPKNTDLKVRFLPSITPVDGLSLSLWGVGVMHDFKQWIPGLKTVPIDMSILVGYTSFSAEYVLGNAASDVTNNGAASFTSSALTYQVLASKKLAIITGYVGLGFNSVTSNLTMTGDYFVTGEAPDGSTQQISIGKDPVNFDATAGGPRATVGLRLKLAIITLHADYTLQKYNTLSAGFGLSIR